MTKPDRKKRKMIVVGLVLTIAFQLVVLGWEYLGSVWPLWFGEKVTLQIEPVDPRSLFRGNYVRLNYNISRIEKRLAKQSFRRGEVAYISLQQQEGFHRAVAMHKEAPEEGLFIRGRVTNTYDKYGMQYGIEAYFLPPKKALAAEQEAQQSTKRASVFILSNGRAAIAGFGEY